MRASLVGIGLSLVLLASPARADDKRYACHEPPANSKITASFKSHVALKELVIWASGFTCKNVVFSAEVERAVSTLTIVSPKQMTPKQALGLFVDSLEALGLVVIVKPDAIVLKLGPKMPVKCEPSAMDPFAAKPAAPDAADPDAAVKTLIEQSIKRVDATHYTIERAGLDAAIANPTMFLKGVRIVPSANPRGFKLYAIRPSSMFAKLGFSNGDTMVAINGFAVDSPDKLLEVYTKLRDATSIQFEILRRGKTVKLSLSVI